MIELWQFRQYWRFDLLYDTMTIKESYWQFRRFWQFL